MSLNAIDEYIRKHCIGITGGIATGKSTVCSFLKIKGFTVFDADTLSREVCAKGTLTLSQIRKTFGEETLTDEGELNRSALAKMILDNPTAKDSLESIVHPAIHNQLRTHASVLFSRQEELFFYEASLIFEKSIESRFREIWCTYCDEPTQITRLIARTGISKKEAHKWLASQMPAKTKAERAHEIINTQKSLADIEDEITMLLGRR